MIEDLQELKDLKNLIQISDSNLVKTRELDSIIVDGKKFPILSFEIGTQDKSSPVLGLFGGVHGLERVGTHVVISYLQSLFGKLKWDSDLREQLRSSRIVAIPLINPAGMAMHRRSNPNGVDLMRNSPVEALDENKNSFLLSGHRISNKLPWYRGNEGAPLEKESHTLIEYVKEQMFEAQTAISVDFHSGFGMIDRFWYPYAKCIGNFPNINEVLSLKDLLDDTLRHHIYKIEPQSHSYTTHGDLWDYIYDMHMEQNKDHEKLFLPFTLEMGSWNWVRKNPRQIFSALGLFNPMIEHRFERTMRRHWPLIDFLFKATRNSFWKETSPHVKRG